MQTPSVKPLRGKIQTQNVQLSPTHDSPVLKSSVWGSPRMCSQTTLLRSCPTLFLYIRLPFLPLIHQFTPSPTSPGFSLFLNHSLRCTAEDTPLLLLWQQQKTNTPTFPASQTLACTEARRHTPDVDAGSAGLTGLAESSCDTHTHMWKLALRIVTGSIWAKHPWHRSSLLERKDAAATWLPMMQQEKLSVTSIQPRVLLLHLLHRSNVTYFILFFIFSIVLLKLDEEKWLCSFLCSPFFLCN